MTAAELGAIVQQPTTKPWCNFSMLLRRDSHSQLIYKHAISTIMPASPVRLNDEDGTSAAGDDGEGAAAPA